MSSAATEAQSHRQTYFRVFVALCVLTALSVAADAIKLSNPWVLRSIILSIAAAKAMCVMLFFMHLKFEKAWKYLLLAPTIVLAISLPLALASDVGFDYYIDETPQAASFEQQNRNWDNRNSNLTKTNPATTITP